jgi:predicted transport protein
MTMLIIDGVKYKLWTPKDEEKEFHPLVKDHYKEIFGKDSLYFDTKHVLKTVSGIGSIPDAHVISLSKAELYVVEIELASHPVYDHIVKQLTKFINGIENLDTRNQIIDMIYDEIDSDIVLRAIVQKAIGSTDIYRFVSKLLSKPPRIVIVVDKKTPEIEEACRVLKYQTDIIQFQTFVREDAPNVKAHLFEPLYGVERVEVKEKEERERKIPEHYKDWQSLYAWVEDNVKDITKALESSIISINPSEVSKGVHGRYLCFYRGKPGTKSIFAAFLLTKKALKVRIRTDPHTFKDPQMLTGDKVYKGWFFKQGQEREFKIRSREQIPYATELIKQSYEISG